MSFPSLYTSATQSPVDKLAELVYKALEQRIKEIVEAEAKRAAIEVETKVRQEVAQIAARVANRMHFERHAHELVIRVDFGTQKNPV